jgi:hypothetical protein
MQHLSFRRKESQTKENLWRGRKEEEHNRYVLIYTSKKLIKK